MNASSEQSTAIKVARYVEARQWVRSWHTAMWACIRAGFSARANDCRKKVEEWEAEAARLERLL